MLIAFRNGRILTDKGFESGKTLLVRDGRIEALVGASSVLGVDRFIDLQGQMLAPGFVDTQVNGGGGVLFNDDPSVDAIRAIGAAHRRFGTTGFLPTLISDDLHVVEKAIDAVSRAIEQGVPGVLGIHVEGPFLAHSRRGIHEAGKLRELDEESIELLTAPTGGVTLVTLAPEKTTAENIRALADAGVVVSAGHTDATFDQLQPALSHGLRGFTHLFNAMSALQSREPGAVGAALASDAWCGIIVDGHHVHAETMKIALRAKRRDRFMLVTDAMPSVGADTNSFQLQGKNITLNGSKIVDDGGRLAGAHLDMIGAVRNSMSMLGLEPVEALRMASAYPAAFLGLNDRVGRLAPGLRADMVVLDDQFRVTGTWIGGKDS